jgi:serine/threonine-protein kinase
MHFRIGIHLGEVTVEEDRLFGDGVDIGARLEAIGEPVGVCISAAVRDQVKRDGSLDMEDVGTRELKNIPDPVHVFRLRPQSPVEALQVSPRSSRRPGPLSTGIAALGVVALAAAAALILQQPEPRLDAPSSFRLPVLGEHLSNASFPPFSVSPDGRRVAYAASTGATTRLFLRSLDRFEAVALEGTEGAVSPFFSPDGKWVGFFAGGALYKVRVSGGDAVRICETSNFSFPSASWGSDGVIRYSRGINVSAGMLQVSANGGEPKPLTQPARGERWHGHPQRLPDDSILFTVATSEGYRAALLAPDGEWRILQELGPAVSAHWVPSGHIVFGQPGRLLAAPWKPGDRSAGSPRPVLAGVHTSRHELPFFALSATGTLVYAPGGVVRPAPVLVELLEGRTTPIADDPGAFQHPRFSPDDRLLAVDITWRGKTDIYVYDLARGSRRRLTHTGFNIDPLWSVDGRAIVFRSTRSESGGQDLYRVAADGNGEAELLFATGRNKIPGSWAANGSLLAFTDIESPERVMTAGVLDLSDGSIEPLLSAPYNVGWPVFSPSGDRVAYVSDESGRPEIWVRPFPQLGAAIQVSLEGGIEPVWSPDGRKLYFRRGTSFFAVPLEGDRGLSPGRARELFEGRFDLSPTGHQHYAIDSTGQRLAAIALSEAPDPETLHMVLGWGSDLERMMPAER